jgi:excisionase family DNA binding protein
MGVPVTAPHDAFCSAGRALQLQIKQLPCTIARMAFLSELRDPNTGLYRHPLVSVGVDRAQFDRLLRRLHDAAFREWLNYRLDEQKGDLDLYLSTLAHDKVAVVRTWRQLESYRSFVPASASAVERRLFFAEIEVLLRLILREAGDSVDEGEPRGSNEFFLTAAEVSRILGISRRTVRLWAETGEMRAVKAGRQWRFRKADVREWLTRRTKRG